MLVDETFHLMICDPLSRVTHFRFVVSVILGGAVKSTEFVKLLLLLRFSSAFTTASGKSALLICFYKGATKRG